MEFTSISVKMQKVFGTCDWIKRKTPFSFGENMGDETFNKRKMVSLIR